MHEPPSASARRPRSIGDAFDELAPLATGTVAGLCTMPGFFLCAPGILLLVVTPLVLIALLTGAVVAVGLLLATPVLVVVRLTRRLRMIEPGPPMPSASVIQLGPPARR